MDNDARMALPVRLDHCVIHVSNWDESNAFYRDVLGAELVPAGTGWAYRFGTQQRNVHGPGLDPTPVARLPVQPETATCALSTKGRPRTRSRIWTPTARRSSWARSSDQDRGDQVAASTSATPTEACSSSSPTGSGRRSRLLREAAMRLPPVPRCDARRMSSRGDRASTDGGHARLEPRPPARATPSHLGTTPRQPR
jgi:hypothetical protein